MSYTVITAVRTTGSRDRQRVVKNHYTQFDTLDGARAQAKKEAARIMTSGWHSKNTGLKHLVLSVVVLDEQYTTREDGVEGWRFNARRGWHRVRFNTNGRRWDVINHR